MVNYVDKKSIFWIICILCLSSFVFSLDPSDKENVLLYYYPNNISTLVIDESPIGTNYNGTAINGVTFYQDGNNEAYMQFVDGSSQYINAGRFQTIENTAHFTISGWYALDTLNTEYVLVQKGDCDVAGGTCMKTYNGALQFHANSGSNSGSLSTISTYINASEFAHIVWVFNGSGAANADRFKVYINNVSMSLNFVGTIPATLFTSSTDLQIGRRSGGIRYYDGKMSNLIIYNSSLNTDEISELYSSGRSFLSFEEVEVIVINSLNITPNILNENDNLTCNYDVTAAENVEIYWYNGTSLIDTYYTAYVQQTANSTDAVFNGTNNGYLYVNYTIPNINNLSKRPVWRVKYGAFSPSSTDLGTAINLPLSCFNTSDNVQLRVYSDLTTSYPQCYDGSTWITVGDVYTEAFTGYGGSGLEANMYDNDYTTFAGIHNVIGIDWKATTSGGRVYEERLEWVVRNQSTLNNSNFALSDNITCEILATNQSFSTYANTSIIIGQTINFTAWDLISNTEIENFSITYDLGTFNATSNNLTIYNYNTTDEYFFTHPDYPNSAVNLTTNITTQSYNFTVYPSESILFTIYRADLYTLLNTTNVTITMFGSTFTDSVYNFTTTNGAIFGNNLVADKYFCEARADDFETNYFNILILNKSFNTKNVYMVNTSDTPVETTYTIIDTTTALQEEITIKTELYNGVDWIYAQECTTTSAGTCKMTFVQPKIVRYSLYNSDGNLIDFFSNEILDYTTRTFTIEEISPTFEKVDYYNDIKLNYYYSITPNPNAAFLLNSTRLNFTIRSQWNNPEVTQVCMRLRTINVSVPYVLFDECINYNLQSQIYKNNLVLDNKTYIFETYIVNTNQEQILDVVNIDFRRESTIFGPFGIFLGSIIIMFGAILGALLGGIDGSIIGALGAAALNTTIGFWPLTFVTLGGLILFGVAFVVLRNR